MANAGTTAERRVADLMTSPPVTVEPGATLGAASQLMQEHGVGSVVVVDGDRAVGIFTERDLVRWGAAGVDPGGSKVAEWMTGSPDTVAPGVSVQEAYDSLAAHGYRHIPVVDADRLVGIVSMRDLLRVASIQPVVHPGTIEAPPGLEGVIVAETEVGDVRGLEGFYHYRQYDAVELAAKRRLEDVWHLLFDGGLPTAAQRADLAHERLALAGRGQLAFEHEVPHALERARLGEVDGRVLAVVVEALLAPDVAHLGLGHDDALEPLGRLEVAGERDRLDAGDPHQVPHRDDADERVAVDHGDVPVAVGGEGVVGDLDARVRGHAVGVGRHPLGDLGGAGVDAGGAPAHEVPLGQDPDGTVAVHHHDGPDAPVAHPARRLGHGVVGQGGDHR